MAYVMLMLTRILPLMASLLPMAVFAQEDVIPSAYSVERYEPLWKKSPFALSSAAVPEAPPVGFADSLALTGILKIGNEVLVSVVDKITKERQMLSAKSEEQAMWVEKLELPADGPDQVAVTLKKGSESAVLRYDMDYLKQVAAVSAPPVIPPPAPIQTANSSSNTTATPIVPRPPGRPPIQRRIIIPSQPPPAPQPGRIQ